MRPWMVYAPGVLPLALLTAEAMAGRLGVDPVKAIEHRLGEVALQLLVAGLCVMPLRRLAGLNLIRLRRPIGILAFAYAGLHLLVWLSLDLQFRWTEIAGDLMKRPYLMLGMVAFLLLVPLAATSNDRALRRLGGARWRQLHRLTYPAALLAALHFVWVPKTWATEPLLYLAGIAALLALRLGWHIRRGPASSRPPI
ncbi:MAG: protein-methionine-sulfoxide reductase heme-binding subunit MsrQ [Gemmobacter sp.]|nr:protein-methionine-sulfoxide reductase heme-binding subunit MsrQ [Gemmobacter sp.]